MKIDIIGKPILYANNYIRKGDVFNAIHWYELARLRYKFLSESLGHNLKNAYKLLEKQSILSLTALSELQATSIPHQWISVGEDPFFLVEDMSSINHYQGWFEINFLIDGPEKINTAKFYLDYGSDFSEDNTVIIPYKSGVISSRVFKAKNSIVRIRFDPLEKNSTFKIKALTIKPISEDAANQHMICRIMQDDKFLPNSTADLFEYFREIGLNNKTNQIETIKDCYESLFFQNDKTTYSDWILNTEYPSLPSNAEMKAVIASMGKKPLISIVMPVYNTPEEYLTACIDSVLAQSYTHWELCIADDHSPQPHIKELLDKYQRRDKRIKVIYRKENGHISKASNSALGLASGDYVALLDHDDLLPEYALYFVAQSINQNPSAQIIYSDEDKIDENNLRFDPHFKSDWNPDLFYSQNYVSHLGVYKREIINKINGFRVGVEGSQDQDLLLRCLPHTEDEYIIHIPKILYHWRALEGSTALAAGEKSYTTQAGVKALNDYFKAIGQPGVKVSEGLLSNTYRVHWPIPLPQPLVSLLIPTRDRKKITELAVTSILEKTTYSNYEIIIIDNGSVEQETLKWFETIEKNNRVRVLRYDKPFNYSAINNFGAKYAQGTLLGLVNNDVEVISPDWLTEMVSHAIRPDIGCVGAKLYYGNNTIQHAGVIIGIGGVAGHSHKHLPKNHHGYFSRLKLTQNLSAVTAACLVVKKSLFDSVNGLDEDNLKIAFNDVDFCLKIMELGFRNVWSPYVELYHHESVSRGAEDNPEKIQRFNKEMNFMIAKWKTNVAVDPFYNLNLTREHEDFSISAS
jgi:O-antigen biosynthesis protein